MDDWKLTSRPLAPRSTAAAGMLVSLPVVLLLFAAGETAARQPCSHEPFETADATGYRDASGAVAIAPEYTSGLPFLETGIAAVVDKMGWAYIDCAGTVLIRPYVFDNVLYSE